MTNVVVPNEYQYGFSKPENYVFKAKMTEIINEAKDAQLGSPKDRQTRLVDLGFLVKDHLGQHSQIAPGTDPYELNLKVQIGDKCLPMAVRLISTKDMSRQQSVVVEFESGSTNRFMTIPASGPAQIYEGKYERYPLFPGREATLAQIKDFERLVGRAKRMSLKPLRSWDKYLELVVGFYKWQMV